MYQVTQAYHDTITQPSSEQDLRVKFSNNRLTLSAAAGDFTIDGITITKSFCPEEDITFGACTSSTLSFTAINTNQRFASFTWGECDVEIGVKINGVYEYCPIGKYFCEKPSKVLTSTVTVADAYDGMRAFDIDVKNYITGISYPTTLGAIYVGLCTFCGVSYESSTFNRSTTIINNNPFTEGSYTGRYILRYIAEFALCVSMMNRLGQNALVPVGRTSVSSIPGTRIVRDGLDIAEYQTPTISKLIVQNSAGLNYIDGTGNNTYIIIGNPYWQSLADGGLSLFANVPSYTPISCTILEADPSIDCGDLVTLTVDNVSYVVPVMTQTISFVGVTLIDMSATGDDLRRNEDFINSINETINTANNAGNIIEKIYARGINADYITTGTLDASRASIINLYLKRLFSQNSSGSSYIEMLDNGLNFVLGQEDTLGIGYDETNNLPYMMFGTGMSSQSGGGMIKKFSNGIWIGDYADRYASQVTSGTGIFINSSTQKIYKYVNGVGTELIDNASVVAVFG